MRWNYARTLYKDPSATLDDLREAVTTLEDAERTARRVRWRASDRRGSAEDLGHAKRANGVQVRKTIVKDAPTAAAAAP